MRRSLPRGQYVAPRFGDGVGAVAQMCAQFDRLVLVLSFQSEIHAPASGYIIAVHDHLADRRIAVDRYQSLEFGIGREFAYRRAVEVDDEADAAVVLLNVTATAPCLRNP